MGFWRHGYFIYALLVIYFVSHVQTECRIPEEYRGEWYSWENATDQPGYYDGNNLKKAYSFINATTITGIGECIDIRLHDSVNYIMVLRDQYCYTCLKFADRSTIAMKRLTSPCVPVNSLEYPSMETVCSELDYAPQSVTIFKENKALEIPKKLRGQWFSWENRQVITEMDATSMQGTGECIDIKNDYNVNYTMAFRSGSCYTCIKLIARTPNVLQKLSTPCGNVPEYNAHVGTVCRDLDLQQQMTTMFSENYVPVNCRSSLEGVWTFAFQNRFQFTGECRHPDQQIRSCQTAGSQFFITNQKFNITYKRCEGMEGTFDGVVEYSCLGDWFVGKNHYFAVANTKESRKDEKYRCFLKNRDDDDYIGMSITAECNTLKTVEKSPVRLHVNPVKSEIVEPGCHLPQNFSGEWINTANIDADVFINETHIIETYYPDEGRSRKKIYVCHEQKDTRIMMARVNVDGCQKDYLCFDFVPQHHNVLRYRKGVAVIKNDFSTVCSWVQFKNKEKWKYELFLKKNPVPIRCPVAGKFNFTQKGEAPFQTRILGGITESPRPNTYCKQNISDYSVCDTEQKNLQIDENYCLSVDHLGRPVDIYSDPDYIMSCIAYWRENLKSYLITYDELDPYSKYRCWVYQRVSLNRILMSQAIGAFCDLNQEVTSWNHTEGAALAIDMIEYERERDQCPLHFDDGRNPWAYSDNTVKVFTFDLFSNSALMHKSTLYIFSAALVVLCNILRKH